MVKKGVLFSDIKSSSKLWSTYPKLMPKLLNAHEQIIRKAASKNHGIIIKTIGDSVMIEFPSLLNAVNAAIEIQTQLRNKPLKFSANDLLQIRIGIAYGDISIKNILIQNHKLRDIFGSTVNLASRMESKVSLVGGFGVLNSNVDKNTLALLKSKCDVKNVHFLHSCTKKVHRSMRLIGECQPSDVLHINDGKEYSALSCIVK